MIDNTTIITYGGEEILVRIFNAIASLMNCNGQSVVRPIIYAVASIGLFLAFARAMFSQQIESLIKGWFLPIIACVAFLLTPTTTVRIENPITETSQAVDNVPFLLGKFAQIVSSIGYKLTRSIELVMHMPNDENYNRTGMIFGSETALDYRKYKLSNGNLAENLRRFTKQCVFYDLALGRYTVDDLRKDTNLWDFLKSNTSKTQLISFTDPSCSEDGVKSKESAPGTLVSCREALTRLEPYFKQECKHYQANELFKDLPFTFAALTKFKRSSEEIINQQLMMSVLLEDSGPKGFAKYRARDQQNNTYITLGALTSRTLVSMRTVFEALVYASFIFVIPLCFLPGGLRFLFNWSQFVVWLQLWPPFYVILNYIMEVVALKYAGSMFGGLDESLRGLSIFTNEGVMNLHEDIYALTGYLTASIPFLSYAILKGGISSIVHLAGSLMTPAHSAATAAASEESTGGYSFSNTSFGQMSYQNSTAFQRNLAPSLSYGHMTENTGTSQTVWGSDEVQLVQRQSSLRTSIFSENSLSQSMQTSFQNAKSGVDTAMKSYQDSTSKHVRNFGDLVDHLADSKSFNESSSSREAFDVQQAAANAQSLAADFAEQTGLDRRSAADCLVSASFNLPYVVGAQTSFSSGASSDELLKKAESFVKSTDIRESLQTVSDFAESKAYSQATDEGRRMTQGYTESLDEVKSTQHQHQSALSYLNQVSANVSWTENNSHSLKKSLDQDFVNWASDACKDLGGFSYVKHALESKDPGIRDSLVNGFISTIRSGSYTLADYQEPERMHAAFNEGSIDPQIFNITSSSPEFSRRIGAGKEEINTSKEMISHDVRSILMANEKMAKSKEEIMRTNFETNRNRMNISRNVFGNGDISDMEDKIVELFADPESYP